MMKIDSYCVAKAEGWDEVRSNLLLLDYNSKCFIRRTDGVQVLMTVKDGGKRFDNKIIIHLTIAIVPSLRPESSDEDSIGHIFDIEQEIFKTFFNDRKFAKAPKDSNNWMVRHYYSVIE